MIKADLVRAFKNAQTKLNTFMEKKENFVYYLNYLVQFLIIIQLPGV